MKNKSRLTTSTKAYFILQSKLFVPYRQRQIKDITRYPPNSLTSHHMSSHVYHKVFQNSPDKHTDFRNQTEHDLLYFKVNKIFVPTVKHRTTTPKEIHLVHPNQQTWLIPVDKANGYQPEKASPVDTSSNILLSFQHPNDEFHESTNLNGQKLR